MVWLVNWCQCTLSLVLQTNGGNKKVGTSEDWNCIRLQLKCQLAQNVEFCQRGPNLWVNGSGSVYSGQCGFGGRPETKSMCSWSSGLYFLIVNGCCLLAFCFSWKTLDTAEVWVHYFSSESCPQREHGDWQISFSHEDKPKHLCWSKICFLLPSNCFCFSVQTSNVVIRYVGLPGSSLKQNQNKVWACSWVFQPPAVHNIKRRLWCICVWRTVVVVAWTWCDFARPFVWLAGPLGLKVFPVGFQHGALGRMKY